MAEHGITRIAAAFPCHFQRCARRAGMEGWYASRFGRALGRRTGGSTAIACTGVEVEKAHGHRGGAADSNSGRGQERARNPIVQANGSPPLAAGVAASLARPGGMVTGLSNFAADISEKNIELLLAAAPRLRRVGFLVDSTSLNRARYLESIPRWADRQSVKRGLPRSLDRKTWSPRSRV